MQKVENLSTEFREWIDNYYNYHFSPEEILGYIYGVLYSQSYRDKYVDFLKQDFPRIPFAESIEVFKEMSNHGWEIIQVHLMNEVPNYGIGGFNSFGSHTVEKVKYDEETKRIYINSDEFFEKVAKEVWEFYIGGYQVLKKYLTSRKKRELSYEEIENVENVVNILMFTIEKMHEIDKTYQEIDNV